jgi:hypothetical protein
MNRPSLPARRLAFIVAGLAASAMSAAFAAPSYACDVGESYCGGGRQYVCECWTVGGCYFADAGVCENLAINFSPAPQAKSPKFTWRHV